MDPTPGSSVDSTGGKACADGLAPELCGLPSPGVFVAAFVAAVVLTVLAVAVMSAAVVAVRRARGDRR